jgi:hypothetical protein
MFVCSFSGGNACPVFVCSSIFGPTSGQPLRRIAERRKPRPLGMSGANIPAHGFHQGERGGEIVRH